MTSRPRIASPCRLRSVAGPSRGAMRNVRLTPVRTRDRAAPALVAWTLFVAALYVSIVVGSFAQLWGVNYAFPLLVNTLVTGLSARMVGVER